MAPASILASSIYGEARSAVADVIETETMRLSRVLDSFIDEIAREVDTMRRYMDDITRESKFMVDDFATQLNGISFELPHSSREPVVYEFIVATTGALAGQLAIGTRRRIPIPANTVLAIPVKMRVYENDQIILTTGTIEAPGAASLLYLEMTGYIYPHVTHG